MTFDLTSAVVGGVAASAAITIIAQPIIWSQRNLLRRVRITLADQGDTIDHLSGLVEQLTRPRQITTKPHDDCECVICETLRNPPKPTPFAIGLMRKLRENQAVSQNSSPNEAGKSAT